MGIVTTTDILAHHAREAYAPTSLAEALTATIMTPNPLTTSADDAVEDALAKMAAANIRHLPVVDGEGRLLGMLTDRDVRLPPRRSGQAATRPLRVADFMNADIFTVGPETPYSRLVAAFVGARFSGQERHVRRLNKVLAIERQYQN